MSLLPIGAFEAIYAEHQRDHDDGPRWPREGCTGCAMLSHAEALYDVIDLWARATQHLPGMRCGYRVSSTCTCGAHEQLASLQAEHAARQRKLPHEAKSETA